MAVMFSPTRPINQIITLNLKQSIYMSFTQQNMNSINLSWKAKVREKD